MDTFPHLKANLHNALEKEIETFKAELSRELSSRELASGEERQIYHAELNILRAKARKVDRLEEENERLRQQLRRYSNVERENAQLRKELLTPDVLAEKQKSWVDVKELELEKAQHDKCIQDLGRLYDARNKLEEKCRKYKGKLEEWNDYCDRWRLNDRQKKHGAAVDRQTSSSTDPEHHRLPSNVPTPPPYPKYPTTAAVSDAESSSSAMQNRSLFGRIIYSAERSGLDSLTTSNETAAEKKAPENFDQATSTEHDETSDDKRDKEEAKETVSTADTNRVNHDPTSDPQAEDSEDDYPVVVSERPVKRSRTSKDAGNNIHVYEDGLKPKDRGTALLVKDEQVSSSPLQPTHANPLIGAYDSLDLDEFGTRVDTPRKRRRLEQMILKSSVLPSSTDLQRPGKGPARTIRYGPASNVPDRASRVRDKGTMDALDENSDPTVSNLFAKEWQKRARMEADIKLQNANNDRVHERMATEYQKGNRQCVFDSRAEDQPRSLPELDGTNHQQILPKRTAALRPTDANVPPRASENIPNIKRYCPPDRRDHAAAAMLALAEDGEDMTPSKNTRASSRISNAKERKTATNAQKSLKTPDAYRRLSELLQDPSPEKAPLAPPSEPTHKTKHSLETPLPTTKSTAKTLSTPKSPPSKKAAPHITRTSKSAHPSPNRTNSKKPQPEPSPPPEIHPEDEPLRARPLHRLHLSDFKLNPTHTDHAYHTTLRTHDEKRSRGGCTDPLCARCKDIAKFVQASGYTPVPNPTLWDSDSPPPSTQAAQQRLLESYLGGDKIRIKTMSAQEREDILLKARVTAFGDRFGKHKQGQARAVSPVGFWNVDMPSTQEEEGIREGNRRLERERVGERYAEAVRGGVWVFADE